MKKLSIASQPDDVTCGPTCLHAVYNYFDDDISLSRVINEVTYLDEGGTLGVMLGLHALSRGYSVTIYTYNLQLFDPSWFKGSDRNKIIELLEAQAAAKENKKLRKASEAYIKFLSSGGNLKFRDLTPAFIKSFFEKNLPVLTGLNSTYLYNSQREYVDEDGFIRYNDIKGISSGHFVVLSGYDEHRKKIIIADPFSKNPLTYGKYYSVNIQRVINSIMLGIITYDANLLVIKPGSKK